MIKNQKELFEDPCWVYVTREEEEYIIAITYDEDFYQKETSAGRSFLLWRKFEDTLSAAGYRMVLRSLSPEALREALRKYNKTDNKL